MITELKVENFKSFGSETRPLPLRPLNFIVGANASGKTNLISALRFLKIALLQNVEIAVAEFEGASEVRNKIQRERKEGKPVRFKLKLDAARLRKLRYQGEPRQALSFCYLVEIDLRSPEEEPAILREEVAAEFSGPNDARLRYEMRHSENQVVIEDGVFGRSSDEPIPVTPQDSTRLAAGTGFFSPPLAIFRTHVEGWSFFNIRPDIARRPLKGAVPGFKSIRTKPLEVEGKWTFQVVEDRIRGAINPRSVSDGTIRLLTLMVIAYWSARTSTVLAVEEPENGLHPHLSRHIVDLLRAASESRQVLVTTHNPTAGFNEIGFAKEIAPKFQPKRALPFNLIQDFLGKA